MKLAAITLERHGSLALKPLETYYSFAARDSLIPVVAAELSQLVPMIPLAFLPSEQSYLLVAVASLHPGSNLYVAPASGQWLGAYVPAALRAYPFRMVVPAEGEAPVLCIDEDSGLLAPKGQGMEFFDAAGKPTKSIQDIADFLAQIERNRRATQAAVDALSAAGVIQPWPLQTEKDGEPVPVNGLFRIDESALNALDAETLKGLGEKGALAIAYAQLFSMNQLSVLQKLQPMREQLQAKAQAAQQAAGASDLNLEFLSGSDTISLGGLH
jgi:hypothetical protein